MSDEMTSRRSFLQTATAAGTAMAATGSTLAMAQTPKPNVVLILADDMGYGIPGCYGQKEIATPNLDRLAAEGMRFTQAYSGATVCAPSRCVLMSGKHTGHANVRGNGTPELGPLPTEPTVAEIFKGAGYRTALVGKWGLGSPTIKSSPNDRGFDHFYGYLTQGHAHNHYTEVLFRNGDEKLLKDNWFDQRKQYAPDLLLEDARKWMSDKKQQPFFLYFPSIIPHANNERGNLTGNGMDVPSDAPYSAKAWPQPERDFAASVTRLDEQVGDIVRTLKQNGQYENTLILFTSDNGPHREGGHNPAFFRDSGPLRGIKRDLYEGGIRVPFIAHWAGRIKPGQVSDQQAAFWDILPTCADLVGAKRPANLDGISLVPAMTGQGKMEGRGVLYWEFHERGYYRAIRRGDWKAIKKNDSALELYDLSKDIGETKNIASEQPAMVKELESVLNAARTPSTRWPGVAAT
jgi:arylsulfatase A-like enzyme